MDLLSIDIGDAGLSAIESWDWGIHPVQVLLISTSGHHAVVASLLTKSGMVFVECVNQTEVWESNKTLRSEEREQREEPNQTHVVHVLSATYGASCGVKLGSQVDVSESVKRACHLKSR